MKDEHQNEKKALNALTSAIVALFNKDYKEVVFNAGLSVGYVKELENTCSDCKYTSNTYAQYPCCWCSCRSSRIDIKNRYEKR